MTKLSDVDPREVEGGFISIRPKVWRGTIRTREDKRVLWTCVHNHSRPEYNARWSRSPDEVWEASALNCGREAYRQLLESQKVKGFNGMLGDPSVPIEMRDDARYAKVGDELYIGRVALSAWGQRILSVSHANKNVQGRLDLDRGLKGVSSPDTDSTELAHWATAAWLLRGGVWGVVFQDPAVRMEVDKPIQRAVDELLGTVRSKKLSGDTKLSLPEYVDEKERRRPSRTSRTGKTAQPRTPEKLQDVQERSQSVPERSPTLKRTKPRLNVRDQGKHRVFEVTDHFGEVHSTHRHRGRALEALNKLLGDS